MAPTVCAQCMHPISFHSYRGCYYDIDNGYLCSCKENERSAYMANALLEIGSLVKDPALHQKVMGIIQKAIYGFGS